VKPNTDIRRASEALRQAIAARPDDFEHPGYEQLEALVDGRLTGADREVVDAHVQACEICMQDVTDLSSVRDAIRPPAIAPARTGTNMPSRLLQIAAAIIAVVGLAMFVRRQLISTPTDAPDLQVRSAAGPEGPALQKSPSPTPGAPDLQVRGMALTADERAIVDRVLSSGHLEMPASVRALTAPTGTLLGAAEVSTSLKPLSPIGTAVLSVTPTFAWRPIAGAVSYTVAVFDEQFQEVGRSPRITETSWTPATALPRGATLAWQVTAHFEGRDVLAPEPPQPEARFLVVDEATASTLAAEQTRLSDQPLVLGVLLAKAGAFDDAARELTRAAGRADTADRAKALLANLKR
jgi:hypothetical protein